MGLLKGGLDVLNMEGGYMEEVNRLEGRINFIEREELTKIKDDISEIKCNQVKRAP